MGGLSGGGKSSFELNCSCIIFNITIIKCIGGIPEVNMRE